MKTKHARSHRDGGGECQVDINASIVLELRLQRTMQVLFSQGASLPDH